MNATPPYFVRLQLKDGVADSGEYPFIIPAVRNLDIEFTSSVTFFVGENGTGKSTVIEAIAALCKLPVSGGGRNELAGNHGPDTSSPLARSLRPSFRRRPPDAYFLRAEFQAHFASLLDARNADPDFTISGDPYARYGGRSLHTRSHGEAFLSILQNRIRSGLLLFDEPESALSPQRQLTLLAHMSALVAAGKSQFIIATHSPILLTFPGAQILSFDGDALHPIGLEDTSHFQITKGFCRIPPSTGNTFKRQRPLRMNQSRPSRASPTPKERGDRTRLKANRANVGGRLRRSTHRLVGNSFSSQESRVQGTARKQHLVQRGLSGRLRDVPLRLRVEVVLCDPTEELLDECWTRAVGAMCQVVH